jgi:hydrogenase expression/formation protein HypC
VPGQIVRTGDEMNGVPMGVVSFGGITKSVCLAYVPEARVGDYVVVHVGFAISTIGEEEAREVFAALRQMGELQELDAPEA